MYPFIGIFEDSYRTKLSISIKHWASDMIKDVNFKLNRFKSDEYDFSLSDWPSLLRLNELQ